MTAGANAPGSSTPFSQPQASEQTAPVAPSTTAGDSSASPVLTAGLAKDLLKKTDTGPAPAPRPLEEPVSPTPRHGGGSRTAPSAPQSQPAPPNPAPANPAPQTAPSTPPAAPPKAAASSAELEEAHSRFTRLRSKALALKNSLGELRQRLASQGMSVNNDAMEAEGNMDSYMQEADHALQAGDASTAQTNLDRAEHEAKKLAAVFGR